MVVPASTFRALWLGSAVAVCALCLIVTLFEPLIPREGIPKRLLDFNLRGEKGAGAWSSGMLLLLSAMHALDGFFAKPLRSRIEFAWGAIALLLILLSIDEVASVHERLGSWAALAPFGVVLTAIGAFGCVTLWRVREERGSAQWITVALCLFASVAAQEHLENVFQWWGSYPSLRVFVEEGTETAAMLLLLWVCMRKSAGLFGQGAAGPVFDALVRAPGVLLVAGLVAAPFFAFAAVSFAHPERGDPALWLVSSSFFIAAVCAVRGYAAEGTQTTTAWAIALLCMLLSLDGIRLSPSLGELSHLLFMVAPPFVCALWYVGFARARTSRRLFFVSAAITALVLGSWFSTSPWMIYFIHMSVSVLVCYGTSFLAQAQTDPTVAVSRALHAPAV